MITVVGGIKGGCGKTTLATNLIVIRSRTGKKCLLVDADEQRSASDWVSQRIALGIDTPWTTIQLSGKSVHSEIKKLSAHYEDIIVDIGGRDTTSQRSALAVADVAIIPFKPRSLDIWTLGPLTILLEEIMTINGKLKPLAIINQADPRGSDNKDAISILEEGRIPLLSFIIGNRKAYANAASQGLGVIELNNKDIKAKQEMTTLDQYIFDKDAAQVLYTTNT